jgi:hypothetical protein
MVARNIYGVNHPQAPSVSRDLPLQEARDRLEEAIDVLDTVAGVKERCKTMIVACEVDAGVNLEGCMGMKGDTQSLAELLAELIARFTAAHPDNTERLYKAMRSIRFAEQAKQIQADLDKP